MAACDRLEDIRDRREDVAIVPRTGVTGVRTSVIGEDRRIAGIW
jgi:hypothetical protein